MNLFAIRKVESVRLPEGLEYTLSSFWIEHDHGEVHKTSTLWTSTPLNVDPDPPVGQNHKKGIFRPVQVNH